MKLAEDCQLVSSAKGAAVTDADVPLLKADVYVAFTAEVTRADKIAPGRGMERSALMMATGVAAGARASASAISTDRRKVRARRGIAATSPRSRAHPPRRAPQMNYNDFLTCLLKLAVKVYPRSRSSDEAFQRLLVDNIIPLASRRCPENISFYLSNAEVVALYDTFKDALEQIFAYYATNDKRAHAPGGARASAATAPPGKGLSHSSASPVRATKVCGAGRARVRIVAGRPRSPLSPPTLSSR